MSTVSLVALTGVYISKKTYDYSLNGVEDSLTGLMCQFYLKSACGLVPNQCVKNGG